MSAFDMSINVGDYGFSVPDEAAIQAGGPPRMTVVLHTVQIIGVQQGQMAAVPFGSYNFNLGREDAIRFFKTGLEQAEQLPPESKIAVATDLRQAEQMGADFEALRGNGTP